MTDLQKLAKSYIDTWNEREASRRRAGIEALYADDASYTDPMADVKGRAAIDTLTASVQNRFPGFMFRLVEPIDAHHETARFTWRLGPEGEETRPSWDSTSSPRRTAAYAQSTGSSTRCLSSPKRRAGRRSCEERRPASPQRN